MADKNHHSVGYPFNAWTYALNKEPIAKLINGRLPPNTGSNI
jgi:hypothetical protein